MERHKLTNELTTEELLKIAESTDDNIPSHHVFSDSIEHEVYNFLMVMNIKPGNEVVKGRLLYELYTKWSAQPVRPGRFYRDITKFLVCYKSNHYLINRNSFKLYEAITEHNTKHSKDITKVKVYKQRFDEFINYYNLKPGNFYVETFIMVHLYNKYCSEVKSHKRIWNRTFKAFCNLYFPKKRITSSRIGWFGIDKETLLKHISQEEIATLRKGYVESVQEKKKQTRKRKIPSTEEKS